ncbi:MAG TPA: AI-2E family transporter [Steroidobacteraceae bacterium]|jgi:predicted PurR-regulated permease PerM|nr:AI-2E family transporter [Steroidobacteraceae bacterium]
MNQHLSVGEFAVRVLIAVALAALVVVLWRVVDIFVLIFGGIVLALVLRSLMRIIQRFTPLHGRWALLVAVVALLVVMALLGLLIGSRVATEMGQLTQTLPQAWQRLLALLNHSSAGRLIMREARSQSATSGLLSHLTDVATITVGAFVDAGVILFTGLFFAVDPDLYRRGLLHLVPLSGRHDVAHAFDASIAALGHWLKGVLLSMLSIGIVTGLGLWALGIPLALSLGILSGVCEFIPYLGPILAAIPAVLVALTLGPSRALEVIVLYLAVHLFEGELLVPMIQRWAVALPPALTIIAVVVFGWLFGVLGIVFATPMAVAAVALIDALYVRAALRSR